MSTTDATTPKRRLEEKLGYGQGTLYSVTAADGKPAFWHVYSDNGKQREVRLNAATKTAALKEAAARNTKRDNGELVAPSKLTFGEVGERWLDSRYVRPRTLALYRQRWGTHIEPRLGTKQIQKLTVEDIKALIKTMRDADLSPAVIHGVIGLVRRVCDEAVADGHLAVSPVRRLKKDALPKLEDNTEPRVLTPEELGALVSSAPASVADFIAFVAATGCRMSEALALRWCDVDLESGRVRVEGQLSRDTFERVPTKSDNSDRNVYPGPAVIQRLKARKERAPLPTPLHEDTRLIFCTATGGPLSHRNVSRGIRSAGDKAGLNPEGTQPVSCHDLRHSFASRLLSQGRDAGAIAAMLGDTIETVIRVYLRGHAWQTREASEWADAALAL